MDAPSTLLERHGSGIHVVWTGRRAFTAHAAALQQIIAEAGAPAPS